jgi:trehalose synthase-fused probable maltokinase
VCHAEQSDELPRLAFSNAASMASALDSGVLTRFLMRQRWFAGKARSISCARVIDQSEEGDLFSSGRIFILEVEYSEHAAEHYLLPIVVAGAETGRGILDRAPQAALAIVSHHGVESLVLDGSVSENFASWLLDSMNQCACVSMCNGDVVFRAAPALADLLGPRQSELTPSWSRGEQSNTSIRYGEKLILKLFRRLQDGENPEAEIGRFLTEKTSFDRVPKTAGVINYVRQGSPSTLGILQNLVPSQSVGWDHMLQQVVSYCGEPSAGEEVVRSAVLDAQTLGRRTAELHLALACDQDDPAFAPEPLTEHDFSRLVEGLRDQVIRVVALLAERLESLTGVTRENAKEVITGAPRLIEQVSTSLVPSGVSWKIRCHGDYHLGQVLYSSQDYFILDFEGEPTKPLEERRLKQSPMKDIVGMMRSYDYASFAGVFQVAESDEKRVATLLPTARNWSRWTSHAFFRSYLDTIGDSPLLPPVTDERDRLMRLYILDKASYELNYELGHRPDWVRIPLLALTDLVSKS